MRRVFHVLERVARSDSTVLLEGESGTGKELAAEGLHRESGREGPFVAVDCGAIPPTLIESELFGHARGAFTGAVADKAGPFEEADGGTLLLDEIGELPLELQPKLLRALETRAVRRVGENQPRPFSARVVAATNRTLAQEVAEGRFRQDLYFRISVIRVRLPPLRERRDEIPRLVAHFLGQLGQDPAAPPPEAMMHMLCAHAWPGNVRELRNVVERLALVPGMSPQFYLGGGAEAPGPGAAVAGAAFDLDAPFHEGKRRTVEQFEREYLARHLDRAGGNISELAREIGLSRQSCHRLLSRYGLV
jgi:DNA-binding NtrC family response regulator